MTPRLHEPSSGASVKSAAVAPPVSVTRFIVTPGPALLSGDLRDPSLGAHRRRLGEVPDWKAAELVAAVESIGLRGRGGAGFAFARKVSTVLAQRRRPVVVVNAAEGEPASAKDAALARCAPHLILDGAVCAAQALGAREMHVIVPGERPATAQDLLDAMAERPEQFIVHHTEGGFVGGQSRAVLELMAGRDNLPVTSWQPEAVSGHRGRPTLLSNAETFAHLGWLALRGPETYRAFGTTAEPGTTLLTLTGPSGTTIHEIAYGDRLPGLLNRSPVLLGGFHGTWVPPERVSDLRVSVTELLAAGTPLGAGVVIAPETCPVLFTADVLAYLSAQRAGRCGPCRFGLPALATAMGDLAAGRVGAADEVARLCGLVTGRGACAHPDGTARLARSLLTQARDEVAAHEAGGCRWPFERSTP